jgi:radical SAM superfamily enzyme YgiQ (UPF0313 family)
MAKILLIQPPHEHVAKVKKHGAAFPYGIGYIASQLLQKGHQVQILDIYALDLNESEVLERVKNFDADIIGISAFSTQYKYVKWLSQEIKKFINCKIVAGGPLTTHSAEVVLKNSDVDICVLGEGELTTPELIDNISSLDKVLGIYYRADGRIVKNAPRPLIKDLDNLPFPAYELFPMDIYLTHTHLMNMEYSDHTLSISTGRGCPYSCNFCSKTFTGIRHRSVDNVIAEIKFLQERYKISDISFQDELFVCGKNRTYEFAEKLAPLKLRWSAQARVNIVDYPLLRAMKKAGCVMVGFGLESGSQEILNRMNKAITVEQSEKAMKAAIRAGLEIKVQLMFNYPGDTKETLQETINLMKRVGHPGRNHISFTTALPGTKLYAECLEAGLIQDEDNYLENLSFGSRKGCPTLINFTNLKTEEISSLIKWACEQMRANYKRYVLNHPSRWGRIIFKKVRNKTNRLFTRLRK